jgi:hypothetical protein
MSTFKQLQENIINEVCNPSAACMATTLDRALNALVENQEHNPSKTFQADYYNLERMRTAVRALADGPQQVKPRIAVEQTRSINSIFTIDITGQAPVWHFAVDSSDNTGEPLLVEVKFNPQPLIDVVQSASPQLIDEQLKGAVSLLKQCSGVKGGVHYADAIDMIEYISEAIQKGVIE